MSPGSHVFPMQPGLKFYNHMRSYTFLKISFLQALYRLGKGTGFFITKVSFRYRGVLEIVLKSSGEELIEGLKAFIEASKSKCLDYCLD